MRSGVIVGRKGVMGFLLGREVGRGWEFDGKGGKGVGYFLMTYGDMRPWACGEFMGFGIGTGRRSK